MDVSVYCSTVSFRWLEGQPSPLAGSDPKQTIDKPIAYRIRNRTKAWVAAITLSIAVAALSALTAPAHAQRSQSLKESEPKAHFVLADLNRWLASTFLLVGEVHDNAEHHRIQTQILERLFLAARSQGRRPALGLEMLDRDGADVRAWQASFRAAVRTRGYSLPLAASADHEERFVIEQMAMDAAIRAETALRVSKGWDWSFYTPLLVQALVHDVDLFAANLPATEARLIVRSGLASLGADRQAQLKGFSEVWSNDREQAMQTEIDIGHCSMLPARALSPMVLAQRARDAVMADAMIEHHRMGFAPVILIAGNGHVRKDLGVPLYLAHRSAGVTPHAVVSIGLLEADQDSSPGQATMPSLQGQFDHSITTARPNRDDPCRAFRARVGR